MVNSKHGYAGGSGASRREQRAYACPCGERFGVEVWRVVDVRDDPEIGRAMLAGRINRGRCPACAVEHEVQVSAVYHDPISERLVLVLPDGLRHRELEERARLYQRLADDRSPPPEYVRRFDVAFGAAELAALVHPSDREGATLVATAPLSSLAADQADGQRIQIESGVAARGSPATPSSTRDDTGRTQVRAAVSDGTEAVLQRWIANREGTAAFLTDDRVVLCAAMRSVEMAALTEAQLELRIQLHRLPSYPLLLLTVIAPTDSDAPLVTLHAPLDVARAAHRALMESLVRRAAITMHIYDSEYSAAITRHIEAPLEENARRLLRDAKDAWGRIAPAARSFERALAAFQTPSFDRLGRIHVALSEVELGPLDSPCALRQSVATVSRWSEPGAEAYLAEVRSFPLPQWRKARLDVVRSALEQGIHAPRALTQKVLAEANLDAEWPHVLQRQVAAFVEVVRRRRPNDLSPNEEVENWRLLAAECQAAGVELDAQARRLFNAAERRLRAAVDLRALSVDQLVALLERKEIRLEAALLLCERHEHQAIAAIFEAVRRMTRAEANRILPSLTVFGEAAERHFVEGLRSRKSFVRQGCALALGTIGGATAAETLSRLLLEEPTEIWLEVARAIGDLGAAAVMPVAGRLREADRDGQARIARALAHVLVKGVRGPVEMLAAGRDPHASVAARTALEIEEEVRTADAEVRGGAPLKESTVVRGFSRRFFEALGGALELSEEDLEMLEEPEDVERPDENLLPRTTVSTRRNPRLPRERNP